MEAKYPEHEKLNAHKAEVRLISEFLGFLDEVGVELSGPARRVGVAFCYTDGRREGEWDAGLSELEMEEVIGAWLDIDVSAFREEKRRMEMELRRDAERTLARRGVAP